MPIVKGVIIGHGGFATAILKTAEQIVGKQRLVEVISNKGLSCTLLNNRIEEVIEQSDTRETIIFVDLPGGSCTISCYNLLKKEKDLNVLCGLNLPVLIEFFMLREKYSARELVPILIEKGRKNIFKLESKK